MSYAPNQTWDLASIFAGGPGGADFLGELHAYNAELTTIMARADALAPEAGTAELAEVILALEALGERGEQINTYAACAAAEDATGRDARRAESAAGEIASRYFRAWVVPDARLASMPADAFAALLAWPELADMRGLLEEKRRLARFRLPEQQQALATELMPDGIMAWGELYDVDSGALKIPFDRGNGVEQLSPGQLAPLFGHVDKATRDGALAAYQQAWRALAPRAARVLTHITGTRRVLNARRGLDVLDEPCANAKIERSTLEAMIEAARRAQPLMHRYLAAKARFMGVDRLSWADTFAHVGHSSSSWAYDAAQRFIVEQFDTFSPRLAEFAKRALVNRWIEAEDRPGKRGGGFCADVPMRKESRIFMTWGASGRSMSTLAHELGHAFHNEVLHTVSPSQRRVPMTLAETASTFAEALVREGSLARVSDASSRLNLVDGSLSDAVAFLCNIPARFELEQALYRLRTQGPIEPEAIEAECVAIFSRWYGPMVDVDPTFWISKAHFYIPTLSFYNFPYTFGFLFSNLVYERYRPLGAAGAPGYERLLRRTGDAWAEPIARDELGLDLGVPETWESALGPVKRDLAAFLATVEGS